MVSWPPQLRARIFCWGLRVTRSWNWRDASLAASHGNARSIALNSYARMKYSCAAPVPKLRLLSALIIARLAMGKPALLAAHFSKFTLTWYAVAKLNIAPSGVHLFTQKCLSI